PEGGVERNRAHRLARTQSRDVRSEPYVSRGVERGAADQRAVDARADPEAHAEDAIRRSWAGSSRSLSVVGRSAGTATGRPIAERFGSGRLFSASQRPMGSTSSYVMNPPVWDHPASHPS